MKLWALSYAFKINVSAQWSGSKILYNAFAGQWKLFKVSILKSAI